MRRTDEPYAVTALANYARRRQKEGATIEDISAELNCEENLIRRVLNINHHAINNKRNDLCGKCANACGGCEWSSSFDPVPGWTAEPVTGETEKYPTEKHPNLGKQSYHITACPKFKEGDAETRIRNGEAFKSIVYRFYGAIIHETLNAYLLAAENARKATSNSVKSGAMASLAYNEKALREWETMLGLDNLVSRAKRLANEGVTSV